MKITVRQLKRIIKEEGYCSQLPNSHIDGQPWPGSLEDLAQHQGRTWGHGEVVDQKGFRNQVKKSKRLAVGKDGSPLQVTEIQLRRMIREVVDEPVASVNTLGSGIIDAAWTPDGLSMELRVNGTPVIRLGRQKDAIALISMLEELLAGPMRTSP